MTEPRGRRGISVAETEDVDQLRARVKELEAELRRRPDVPPPAQRGDAFKVVAAGLGVTTVVLAWPAFLTVRRWVRWWAA